MTIVEFSRHTIGPDIHCINLIRDNPSWPDVVLKNFKWNTFNKSPKFQSLKYCIISFSPSVLHLFLHITMTHAALQNYGTCASIEPHLRAVKKSIVNQTQENRRRKADEWCYQAERLAGTQTQVLSLQKLLLNSYSAMLPLQYQMLQILN